MTDSKVKSDPLGKTCLTYLREQFIAEKYGREKDIVTNAIQKGLMNEEIGITMLSVHLGEMITKNQKHYRNEYTTGTPDTEEINGVVYDIKCSSDIFTFAKAEVTKDYLYQLQVYMSLMGLKKSCLCYVLTDTPEEIIQRELKSILWKVQEDDVDGKMEENLRKLLTYSDIPDKDRIKLFPIDYDPEMIDKLHAKIELARPIYEQMTL